jgi:hypothetical protein
VNYLKGKLRENKKEWILDLIPTNRMERGFLKMVFDENALRVVGITSGSNELTVTLPSTADCITFFVKKDTIAELKGLLTRI